MPTPTIDLTGRTALVTGASRGIGLAIAKVLAQCGADVIGLGTALTQSSVASEFAGLAGTFEALDCDLSDRDAIDRLIAHLDAEGQEIDILINNAGIIRRTEVAGHSTEDWDAVMAVNLDAVFILTREFGKRMVARGHGTIVIVAAVCLCRDMPLQKGPLPI